MNYYSPFIAALVTFLLTLILLRSKAAHNIKDIPNERSLHIVPIPRIGGVALIIGIFSGWALLLPALQWWLVIPVLSLFLLSILDDMHGLPVRYRLLIHLVAAGILVFGAGLFTQNFLLGIVLLFIVVWLINLYNFMDGSDGLAGGMALIGFSMYGIAALQGNAVAFALLNFSIASAAFGFLFFNFHPAKIFMGDAGSIPLGFLVAAMGIWGWQIHLWSVWFPLLVFSPFILDATVTLSKRALRGEKIWQAHREHYYQRMVQLGLGHRNTALIEFALMVCVGASALASRQYPEKIIVMILVWGVIYLVAILIIEHHWKNKKNA